MRCGPSSHPRSRRPTSGESAKQNCSRVVRIRLTAAVIRAESAGSLMWAACRQGRQFLVRFLNHALDFLQSVRAGTCFVSVVQRLQKCQVFAGLRRNVLDRQSPRPRSTAFPIARWLPARQMFSAIWVSTGKSASATLIHCALHPVAINEMLKTNTNTTLVVELTS